MQWLITFKKYEYIGEQKGGVGTPIYIEGKAAGPLMKIDFEITEWEENERIRLQMTSKDPVRFYEQLWTLTPIDTGTKFTFYEEIIFPLGVIGKLIGLVGQGSSYRTVTEMQTNLKNWLKHSQTNRVFWKHCLAHNNSLEAMLRHTQQGPGEAAGLDCRGQ